ncbi:extradiol ring-cleavage dioxygenase [Mycolicibacterium novocastrense]|uniref:Extradiol ring-cleavage dioxygenase n=1 Tax=Mycolicibacterium novocastrense TaxID=59813 RepID=A0AAW5SWX5_MYCNV|nr:extradiol ring-cleavage dioxygenase [Mycolicibacterium novocastrense]MCV7027562.1 extradiol ring-cleavage dioxygenase [Mycolicibacterium novocastrense]GAT12219.1 extradiol ring-cleavage dioxygenase III subunit B [Mycolicibacterium novocastrense]
MGEIVAGYASSHAFTFIPPPRWEGFRIKNRQSYTLRRGKTPPDPAGRYEEPFDDAAARYAHIENGLQRLRDSIRQDRLDCLIIIGDDQNENFDGSALPQIAIHTGDGFTVSDRFLPDARFWKSSPELSRDLSEHTVEAGFDVATVVDFRETTLHSHAHGEIVANILGDHQIPVVLVFLNAVHVPSLSPKRCFALGRAIADAVRSRRPADERIGLYASGGLSHFTAGYPWAAYDGPRVHGSIDDEFDRRTLKCLATGNGYELSKLTSEDLLNSGNIELRSWICAVGAVGGNTPWASVYEPIPRALMGMAVAWTNCEVTV